jgi:hypothetical protein
MRSAIDCQAFRFGSSSLDLYDQAATFDTACGLLRTNG